MATLVSTTEFANLTDEKMFCLALDAGEVYFKHMVEAGHLNGDSLATRCGVIDKGEWFETVRGYFGPDAAEFFKNIGPVDGKLNTVIEYRMNSGDAVALFGDQIPDGPRSWTGGVYHVARANTVARGVLTRIIAVAGSGVQGVFDQSTMLLVATTFGGFWEQKMCALYGKA